MVIDKSPQENPTLPVGENKPNYSHSWVHPRCGTTLQSPPEGRKNIPCDGCGVIVSIPSLNSINRKTNGKKTRKNHMAFGNMHLSRTDSGKTQTTLAGGFVDSNSKPRVKKINTDAKIVTLKNKASWKKLFHEFTEMYGVTYMSSPQYLLSLFDDQGFEKVELLIGHGLVEGYRQKLNGNDSAVERLFELVQNKSLTVYGTKATNHAKLYILKKEGSTRVVMGSPNLSYTAEGSRQREICVYWDIEGHDIAGHEILRQAEENYQIMLNESDRIEFMSDLIEQIIDEPREQKIEQFQLWTRDKQNSEAVAVRAMFSQIKGQAFNESKEEFETEIEITIPELVKNSQKKFLTTTLGAKVSGNRASIPIVKYLDHRTMSGTVPMELNEQTGEIKFGIAGEIVPVPQEISDAEINQGLDDIEKFIGTERSCRVCSP